MVEAINYQRGVENAWSNVATFIPKLVIFLLILVVGYFVAKAVTKILSRVLTKVGFDRAVERGGIRKALESSQYDASDILAKLVFYAIMLFVLSTAFGVFGPNPISDYLHAVIAYLPLVFVAILIVVIASAVAAAVKTLIQGSLSGLPYGRVLANSASGLILALGVVAALDQLHIATRVVDAVLYAALAAVVGVIIVAVGGGGVRTMSSRWEATAARYDEEKPRIAAAARNAPGLREQARQAAGQSSTSGRSGNHGGASASGQR